MSSMISENVNDRLSRLPEEILPHILSLMPTKFAIQTSILSKRWRYIWMFVTNLDFGDIDTMDSLHSLTIIMDRVLKFCTPSQVKLFRLRFPQICARNSSVSNWIDELVKLKVSELDLQVHQLQLPPSMFTCKTLTKLRLHPSNDDNQNFWEFQCPIDLPCLRTLDIVVFANPFDNAFKLISGCKMLESLFLDVTWPLDKKDYVFNIPTLKRLKLTTSIYVSFTNKVVLRVPNLEYLYVESLCSIFVMEDVSSLVEASVSLSYMSYNPPWVELLKGLSGVKSLSIQNLSSLVDFNPFTSSPPIFSNMKQLVLDHIGHCGQVIQFLESSPELEQLCIKVHPYREMPEESSWVEPEMVPACMTANLTTIKFTFCKWWECDIPVLKYMLGNAKVLKMVKITWKNMSIEQEKLLCAEAVKLLPRASRYCEIFFL